MKANSECLEYAAPRISQLRHLEVIRRLRPVLVILLPAFKVVEHFQLRIDIANLLAIQFSTLPEIYHNWSALECTVLTCTPIARQTTVERD